MIKYNINEFISDQEASIIRRMVRKGDTHRRISTRLPHIKESNVRLIIHRLGI